MDKLHWYCLKYFGMFINNNIPPGEGSCYVGCVDKDKITFDVIRSNEKLAMMDPRSILTGCFYLGYMTVEEFGAPIGLCSFPQISPKIQDLSTEPAPGADKQ